MGQEGRHSDTTYLAKVSQKDIFISSQVNVAMADEEAGITKEIIRVRNVI